MPTGSFSLCLQALVFYAYRPLSFMPTGPFHVCLRALVFVTVLYALLTVLLMICYPWCPRNTARHLVPIQVRFISQVSVITKRFFWVSWFAANMQQPAAVCCSILQYAAVYCSKLQYLAFLLIYPLVYALKPSHHIQKNYLKKRMCDW